MPLRHTGFRLLLSDRFLRAVARSFANPGTFPQPDMAVMGKGVGGLPLPWVSTQGGKKCGQVMEIAIGVEGSLAIACL